jgi:hypothetical protein
VTSHCDDRAGGRVGRWPKGRLRGCQFRSGRCGRGRVAVCHTSARRAIPRVYRYAGAACYDRCQQNSCPERSAHHHLCTREISPTCTGANRIPTGIRVRVGRREQRVAYFECRAPARVLAARRTM